MWQLRGRCLPTARAINNLNKHLEKEVYEEDLCPLCLEAVGDDFHAHCGCTLLDQIRRKAMVTFHKSILDIVTEAVSKISDSHTVVNFGMSDKRALWEALFPDSRDDFQWGKTPEEIRRIVHGVLWRAGKRAGADSLCNEIKSAVWELYGTVWDGYKSLLVAGKKDFRSRLQVTNGITVEDLRRRQNS